MNWIDFVVSILAGLVVCIPLAAKLVKYVQIAVSEKNWAKLVAAVLELMEDAEGMFEKGSTKKEWVMGGIRSFADKLGYEYDEAVISEMVDSLCSMSKVVNAPETEA